MQLGQPKERPYYEPRTGSHYIRTYGKFAVNTLSRSTSHWKLRDLLCDFKYSFESDLILLYTRITPFRNVVSKLVLKGCEVIIGFRFVRVNMPVRLRLAAISITIIDVTRRTVNKRRNHICIHRLYWRSSRHIKLRLFYEIAWLIDLIIVLAVIVIRAQIIIINACIICLQIYM